MATMEGGSVMSNPTRGFYWHVHHNVLIEYCHGYEERVRHIRATKPLSEIETRLHLFKPVIGALPDSIVDTAAECAKAWAKYAKTRAENDGAEYDRAAAEFDRTIKENKSAIEALHSVECPNCPWDGKTIFPEKEV